MRLLPLFFLVGLLGASAPASSVPSNLTAAARSLSYSRTVTADRDRLDTILVETYETAAQAPVFDGPMGQEATALLGYAVMYTESGLRPHIERCDCTKGDGDCDHGHAYGLGQVHAEHFQGHTRDEVCSNRRLQIELSMEYLARTRAWCGASPEIWTGGYNAGACRTTHSGLSSYGVFRALLRKAGIKVRPTRDKRWVAESLDG